MNKLVRWCGKSAMNAIVGVLSIALIVVAWYQASPMIVHLLDFNLQAVKAACALLPDDYGAMAESALRALAADKVLLFFEVKLAIKGFLWGLRSFFTSGAATPKLAPS